MSGRDADTDSVGSLLFQNADFQNFAREVWGVRTAFYRSAVAAQFFSLEEFGFTLAQPGPYAAKAVRVSRAMHKDDDNRRTLELLEAPLAAQQALARRECITVNRLERFLDVGHPLVKLHRDLCMHVGAGPDGVQIAAFHSSEEARAFGRHADRNHILVLQVEGSKVWEVDCDEHPLEYEMQRGDLLYVPYGVSHAVRAGPTVSLSLTFILRMPTWREVALEAFLHRLDNSPSATLSTPAPLPLGWVHQLNEARSFGPPEAVNADEIVGLTHQEWLAGASHLALQNLPAIPNGCAVKVSGCPQVRPETVLRRGWRDPLVVLDELNSIRFAAPGLPQILVSATIAPALEFVRGAESDFAVLDLPDIYDIRSKLRIAQCLLDAGYVRISETPVGVFSQTH